MGAANAPAPAAAAGRRLLPRRSPGCCCCQDRLGHLSCQQGPQGAAGRPLLHSAGLRCCRQCLPSRLELLLGGRHRWHKRQRLRLSRAPLRQPLPPWPVAAPPGKGRPAGTASGLQEAAMACLPRRRLAARWTAPPLNRSHGCQPCALLLPLLLLLLLPPAMGGRTAELQRLVHCPRRLQHHLPLRWQPRRQRRSLGAGRGAPAVASAGARPPRAAQSPERRPPTAGGQASR